MEEDQTRILTQVPDRHTLPLEGRGALSFSELCVNLASVATFWVSQDGQIKRVNRATCHMLGYSEEELLSLHKFQLRTGVTLAEWPAHWEELRQRTSLHFECLFRHRDGREFPAEVESNHVEFEGTEYVFFFVRDITERKRNQEVLMRLNEELEMRVTQRTSALEHANRLLHYREEQFRQVVETLPQLVWSATPDGQCDYLSPQWTRYTGIREACQLGLGWIAQVHPDEREFVAQQWRSAVENETPLDVEFRIRRHDGVYRWFKTRALPLRSEAGQLVKWFGTNTDIEDLRRAEDQAVASLREKETLLKEIHHRVKNNMQLISSLLHLQSGNILNPEAVSILRESQNRVRSMALIHEKLYRATTLSEIDFGQYIESLVSILAPSYATHPERIRVEIRAELALVEIDLAIPLALILNELVSNSLKHAFPQGAAGRIQISLDAATPDGKDYRLVVMDDGVGLPKGLDWRRTSSLGLHLVRILTDQIDGVIELLPGPGTHFELLFRAIKRTRSL